MPVHIVMQEKQQLPAILGQSDRSQPDCGQLTVKKKPLDFGTRLCGRQNRVFLREISPMQLTSKDGNMVVDFYPVKFATGEIHNRLMLKVVTFMGKTQSKRYINKKDFQYEFDSRTHGYGYQVTDESMIPQLFNSAMGCAC